MHSKLKRDFSKQRTKKKDKPLILVVDDDRDNLLLASYVIDFMGIDFVVTDDSRECFSLVEELLPDSILLDIVMPEINGIKIARTLKGDPQFANIPLLAVTGLTQAEDRHRLDQAGFSDYLAKPYLIEDLEAKIRSLLKHHLV